MCGPKIGLAGLIFGRAQECRMKLVIEVKDGSNVQIYKKVTEKGMQFCLDWFAKNEMKEAVKQSSPWYECTCGRSDSTSNCPVHGTQ